MRHLLTASVAATLLAAASLVASPQASPFLPVDQVRPGMTGVGRTVFSGDAISEFTVTVVGVLKNVIGPHRDLILAKLDGGPIPSSGVIQGMSGSPVYVDGKLLGAVSFALGSFPREPYAGITPIAEMIDAVNEAGPRASGREFALSWPATPAQVYGALHLVAERASGVLRTTGPDFDVLGPRALADLAPQLRPIGSAMIVGGLEPEVDRDLRQALASVGAAGQPDRRAPAVAAAEMPLRPGDAVGVSLIRGDLEIGATGTVTYVDGGRVYAFGHPLLNLGPTSFAMTRSHVYAVLPSLDSSFKIASLGPVVGTVSQDRATAIGGTLGDPPHELKTTITISSDRAPDRTLTFYVLHDQLLTPLFGYVALFNSLSSYERQAGTETIAATGSISFGRDGAVALDDLFSGDSALTAAVASLTAPIGAAAGNEFRAVLPESMELHLRVSERQQSATIERAWLDTTRPKAGGSYSVQVLLRDYRGSAQTVSVPITMPSQVQGPLTLLVSDAPTLTALEQKELKPGRPTTLAELMAQLNSARRNNRLYVRLLSASPGSVVGGETLPALPASVRSILDGDTSVALTPLSRTVIGAWEQRLDRVVRGSRELTITLSSSQ